MKLIIKDDYDELSVQTATLIKQVIMNNDCPVLCFPTGGTPVGTYKVLVKMFQEGKVSFNNVISFNLDEYVGIDEENPNSYHAFMMNNLFNYINIKKENIYIPNGNKNNLKMNCRKYNEKLDQFSKKDLLLTGIGHNGHLGFNEPSDKLDLRTHIIKLTENTRNANERFFNSLDEVPKRAITMGIKDILKFEKIIVIASGNDKIPIVKQLLYENKITTSNPSSLLYLHPDVTLIIDKEIGDCLS